MVAGEFARLDAILGARIHASHSGLPGNPENRYHPSQFGVAIPVYVYAQMVERSRSAATRTPRGSDFTGKTSVTNTASPQSPGQSVGLDFWPIISL